MKKTLLSLTLFTTFALMACSKEADTNAPAAASTAAVACESAAVQPFVQEQFNQTFASLAQRIPTDSQSLLDGNKLTALTQQIIITPAIAQTNGAACQSAIRIEIPAALWQQATRYAPLWQMPDPAEWFAQKLVGSNVQFDGQNVQMPFNFALNNQTISPSDANIAQVAQLIAEALLPATTKDKVQINGKTVSRDQALKLLQQPPKEQAASEPALQPVEVPRISEDSNDASHNDSASAPESEKQPAPQTLTPPSNSSKTRVTKTDLDDAVQAHNQANQAIKGAWRNISPEIQQDLVAEQREWESRKDTSCGNAAAKGNSPAESQYLRMQCDTRLTRERVQYLKGFSIE